MSSALKIAFLFLVVSSATSFEERKLEENWWQRFWNGVTSFGKKIVETARGIWDHVKSAFSSIHENLKRLGMHVKNTWDMIKAGTHRIWNAVKGAWEDAKEGDWEGNFIETLAGNIQDFFDCQAYSYEILLTLPCNQTGAALDVVTAWYSTAEVKLVPHKECIADAPSQELVHVEFELDVAQEDAEAFKERLSSAEDFEGLDAALVAAGLTDQENDRHRVSREYSICEIFAEAKTIAVEATEEIKKIRAELKEIRDKLKEEKAKLRNWWQRLWGNSTIRGLKKQLRAKKQELRVEAAKQAEGANALEAIAEANGIRSVEAAILI